MIRVLLADDQALVREGLRLLLELQGDLEVTAVADGTEAVERVQREAFDVALLDVRMPRMDGITCLRRLRALRPDLPVLMLTTFGDDGLVRQCLAAGAAAYLLKDVPPEDLANAVRLVVLGGGLIPGDLARSLVEGEGAGASPGQGGLPAPPGPAPAAAPRLPARRKAPGDGPPRDPRLDGPEPLTARQREVLELLAEGLSNREIAARLHLSEGTVKNVVSEIYARLQVRDRVQAVLRARGWQAGAGPDSASPPAGGMRA
ncbi:two component transcriptional regulator, LuxR family [Thermaerobacter marianensis DSM 12885]|uniref:Stage 0 sporulation protein A homolog n=2 Tax=Thermaerobacter marianensis TaxID=73919 RepID=E6SJW5_THEM7|nr:two component transcriptional regulator, LuxR family [Thermaerobacter marianensis DSM 12885]